MKLTVLLAGLCLAGCSRHAEGQAGEETEAKEPVPVRIATAGPQTLQPVLHLSGRVTLDPSRVATLSAPFEAMVESIPATEGQHVAKDALLVKMDVRPQESAARKATAVLAKSRAALDLLKNGPRPEDIEVARQEVVARQTELLSQQTQLKARDELRQKNMISAVELEDTQRKLQAIEAAFKAARAKLDLLEKGPRAEEIAQATAEVQGAAAEESLTQLHLEQSAVRAPIEGELVKIAVHPGMALAVAAPIAEIVDLRNILVETVIPASRLSEVRLGNTAHITAAAWPDQPFEGKVVRISHQADADSGNVPMWIGVDNPEQLLRRDMVVRVTIDASPVLAKVVIPESAVIELDGQLIAMVVKDDKTRNVPVRLGKRVENRVEVLEGITAGDMVVTSGGYGLEEGHPVKAEEVAASQPAESQPAAAHATAD